MKRNGQNSIKKDSNDRLSWGYSLKKLKISCLKLRLPSFYQIFALF